MLRALDQNSNKLQWWTWVMPLLIVHLGTRISLWSNIASGSSLFYLPVPFALVLTYWWGPRVLVGFYLNAVLSAGLFGLEDVIHFPLYALPEVVFVFLSWLFFIRLLKGRCWLPNISDLAYFLALGLMLPLVITRFMLEGLLLYFGAIPGNDFWTLLLMTGVGDFISIFGFSIPILYFATGVMVRNKLTYFMETTPPRVNKIIARLKIPRNSFEIFICLALALVLSQTLNFAEYWFLYGILSLYVAIRYGFGIAILFNSYILLLTYVLPSLLYPEFARAMIINNEMIKIQVGSGLLYVFSTVAGRVMSDAGALEKQLSLQNKELEQANKELDRFVYSVSHDLSAPLRSILGLVNISRIEQDEQRLRFYIDNIEASVNKLENFINEILEYSRNERQKVILEDIDFLELCREILDNLKFQENFGNISIDLSGISSVPLRSDKMRLKIILNNLLSNAIKFQAPKKPNQFIRVSLQSTPEKYLIEVEDNGEGIKPEFKGKIFEMFFRGTQRSKGSGLGLYIALEAAEKIHGKITVSSEFGVGTLFHVEIMKQQ